MAQKDPVQYNHLLNSNTFSFILVQARFWDIAGRGTLDPCDSLEKRGNIMSCYRGVSHPQRKDREGMVCAAAIRVGLDLSPMGDCKGLLFVLGFSYLCLIGHASGAVLISFKRGLAAPPA